MAGTPKLQKMLAGSFVAEALSKLSEAKAKLAGGEREVVAVRARLAKLIAELKYLQTDLRK